MPFSGDVVIMIGGGVNTNVTLGAADTVYIWDTGIAVMDGVNPYYLVTAGIGCVLGGVALVAYARRIARWFTGGMVKEV